MKPQDAEDQVLSPTGADAPSEGEAPLPSAGVGRGRWHSVVRRMRQIVNRSGHRWRRQARLESGLEHLHDLRWLLRDDEGRYRELLDAQTDIIMRVDESGRLTFVNRAFCDTFDVQAAVVLGRAWQFAIEQGDGPEPGHRAAPGVRLTYELMIGTISGPRWFAFEQHAVSGRNGGCEQQIVGRDITRHRAALDVLDRARDEAEAASRAKSRFLATMSHEIRTPMNGILGMAGLLIDADMTSEQRTYALAIEQSARNLLQIIDEILDLSKVEAGRFEIHAAPFSLDVCVQNIVELLAPRAAEKGLELVWRVDPRLPRTVVGDETRVRQIVLNLVANAIKFTDAGGVTVRVGMGPIEEAHGAGRIGVEIAVADTGIGISAEEAASLIGSPDQTREAVARHRGGTGLGLAISNRLARAMEGGLTVESRPGLGSTFVLQLPLGRLQGPSPMPMAPPLSKRALLATTRPLERSLIGESLTALDVELEFAEVDAGGASAVPPGSFDVLIADAGLGLDRLRELVDRCRASADGPFRAVVMIEPGERSDLDLLRDAGFDGWLVRPVRPLSLVNQLGSQSNRSATIAATSLPGRGAARALTETSGQRTILLVEDNDINALLAKRVGELAGCRMLHAKSGGEALRLCEDLLRAARDRIDFVLMDIRMPGMDGFETIAALRRLYDAAGVPMPPVAAVTANAYPEDRRRCRDAGFIDFLAKPFERDEFEALLARWSTQ